MWLPDFCVFRFYLFLVGLPWQLIFPSSDVAEPQVSALFEFAAVSDWDGDQLPDFCRPFDLRTSLAACCCYWCVGIDHADIIEAFWR